MSALFIHTGSILIGYTLGCLPTGYLLVRNRLGCDVRSTGSGGTGATNVGRLLGTRGFVVTLAGDASKGALALILAKWIGCQGSWLGLVLLAVVAGHVWPAQLDFKGGKGVAPALGGLAIYDPLAALILTGVFCLLSLFSGNRQTAGMILFPILPCLAIVLGRPVPVTVIYLALASVLIWAHRSILTARFERST